MTLATAVTAVTPVLLVENSGHRRPGRPPPGARLFSPKMVENACWPPPRPDPDDADGAHVVRASLGLGIDESYMVASGRTLHLSYFDHPPLSWWMAWGAAHLFGTDAAWAVRLPFVLTFAGATWLVFRLTERLFDARAGLWAAALLNVSPVFGITTGSWVLPDGPLMAGLAGAGALLRGSHTVPGPRRMGLVARHGPVRRGGVAVEILGRSDHRRGAILSCSPSRAARRWLVRPHPYVAGCWRWRSSRRSCFGTRSTDGCPCCFRVAAPAWHGCIRWAWQQVWAAQPCSSCPGSGCR